MGEVANRNQVPQPINIWLESLKSSVTVAGERREAYRIAEGQKDEAILLLLGKLALVYWRPDFSPGQAKQLYLQYLDDLRPFAFKDIAEAIEKYRQNPESKFYPTPGQLRGIIETVPSWDVITKARHVADQLKAGRDELEKMATNHTLLTHEAAE